MVDNPKPFKFKSDLSREYLQVTVNAGLPSGVIPLLLRSFLCLRGKYANLS